MLASIAWMPSACGTQNEVSFIVLVKSSNYAQDASGDLTLLNLRTTGTEVDSTCPDVAPPMDTGQTDRVEPTARDSAPPESAAEAVR